MRIDGLGEEAKRALDREATRKEIPSKVLIKMILRPTKPGRRYPRDEEKVCGSGGRHSL